MGFFLDFVSFGGFRKAFVIYIFHLKKRKEKKKNFCHGLLNSRLHARISKQRLNHMKEQKTSL